MLTGVDEPLQAVSMDGNVLRGTARAGVKKSGIYIVSAWASAHSLMLGQEKVAAKSNKKTVIPDLLRALDLRQTLVSCDSTGCPLSNADLLAAGGGQYVLAPKKNLPVAYEQIAEHFGKRLDQLSALKDVDFGSGRIGRRCTVETQVALLDGLADWAHLRSMVRVDTSWEING